MTLPSLLVAAALPVILFLALWALIHGPLIHLVHAVKAGARSVSGRIARSAAGTWLSGHSGRFGGYAPALLIVAGGGLTAPGAGCLFVELSEHLRREASTVNAVDQAVHAWFGQERQPVLTALPGSVTQFGGTIALSVIVAGVAAILLVRKDRATMRNIRQNLVVAFLYNALGIPVATGVCIRSSACCSARSSPGRP
jgi:hypothetical protein